jgi:hypothetical protein
MKTAYEAALDRAIKNGPTKPFVTKLFGVTPDNKTMRRLRAMWHSPDVAIHSGYKSGKTQAFRELNKDHTA